MVEECSKAVKSSDARDKYFFSYVGNANPFPARELRHELPSLEAARASLAACAAELVEALPQLDHCLVEETVAHRTRHPANITLQQGWGRLAVRTAQGLQTQTDLVNEQNNLDVIGLDALLKEARTSILDIRRILA